MSSLPPFSGDRPTCHKCRNVGAHTRFMLSGHCEHLGDQTITTGFEPNERLHRECGNCRYAWDEAVVDAPAPSDAQQQARHDLGVLAQPEDLTAALGSARVRFWKCVNPTHQRVRWINDVAVCETCGLTSTMTEDKIQRVRRAERARVAVEFQAAADAIQGDAPDNYDALAAHLWGTCQRSHDHPAVLEDPRTIATAAYRFLADRLTRGEPDA